MSTPDHFGTLRQRQVEVGFGKAVDQAAGSDVAGNANYGRYPRFCTLVPEGEDVEPQRFSNRRLPWPEPSRKSLADNDHGRGPTRVGGREVPPGDDGNAERREVAGVDDVPGRKEIVSCAWLVSRSHAANADAFEPTGGNARERRVLDDWCLPDAVDYRPPERGRPGLPLPGHRRVEHRDVNASRIETWIRGTSVARGRARTTRRARQAGHCTRSVRQRKRSGDASARKMTELRP